MKPTIPPPLDPDDFSIEVVDCTGAESPDGRGDTCATYRERSAVRADAITVADPRFWSYAVAAALRGQVPRTRCFVVPTRTGGVAFDLGRGPVAVPQIFGGATCRPEPWGRQCDEGTPERLPPHEAFAPAPHVSAAAHGVSGDADEVVLYDGFDWMEWPTWRTAGGEA